MNASFICIKVDREERPDVDQIYMTALQSLGPGGWPMSLFLTPDGRPFFGGTYFPPRDREGATGFLTIVREIGRAWGTQRPEIERTADAITDALRRRLQATGGQRKSPLSRTMAEEGQAQLSQQYDPEYGGFGFSPNNPRRPKFPEPVNLIFLLDRHRRGDKSSKTADPLKMVLFTLDRLARGGIRDHLGGGYHRYSTDRYWVVPHFEKMLYDNAQLASVHVEAFELTNDPRWRQEAEATFAFIEQKMTAPEGGFYSALDAETNGKEGAYYVWTRDEIKAALAGQVDAEAFELVYGVRDEPSIEGGYHVLHEPRTRAEQAAALGSTTAELEARLRPLACAATRHPRETHGSAPRRKDPHRLEWLDDRRVRGRIPRIQAREISRGRRTMPPDFCSTNCDRPTAACFVPTERARPSCQPTSRTTPS